MENNRVVGIKVRLKIYQITDYIVNINDYKKRRKT